MRLEPLKRGDMIEARQPSVPTMQRTVELKRRRMGRVSTGKYLETLGARLLARIFHQEAKIGRRALVKGYCSQDLIPKSPKPPDGYTV